MRFRDLCKFNIALLAKQGWRFIVKPESLVTCIFKAKYFSDDNFWGARLGASALYVWRSIFAAQKVLEVGMSWIVGSGTHISIWWDN